MDDLAALLRQVAALHPHLCPRQVLGVRMGMLAGTALGLDLPQTEKRLFTVVETDGCFADGVSVATNCWVGRRTLRVEDYGKVAATFVETSNGRAIRLAPRLAARRQAVQISSDAVSRWEAMLLGYQRMADEELFEMQDVCLSVPLEGLISRSACRSICENCGEEIMNERQVRLAGHLLCRGCAGEAYYRIAEISRTRPEQGNS